MKTSKIKLNSDEFWPLLNVLNEVCYGIKIANFENAIGEKKQTVIDFMDKISHEEGKSEVILILNDAELIFLKNSFREVFKQIDEWEFQTRIGILKLDAKKILDKLLMH